MNNEKILAIIKAMVRGGEAPSDVYKKLKELLPSDLVDQAARRFEEETGRIRTLTTPVALRAGSALLNWYMGPSDTDVYWPRLKRYLIETKNWSPSAIDSLDQSSTRIVSLLDAPGSPKIDSKGLVVGYVQSGKTANFTAVIAKAADAGYRFFIVLSGMTNLLRKQTQLRLQGELAALNPDSWFFLTDAARDFGQLGAKWNVNAFLTSDNKAVLCVVKKNATILRKLLRWLKGANTEVLSSCPIIVIDDEADQASVNSASLNSERTAVNRLILEILKVLPKVAYVGYTATPFANVLIDPDSPEDLYPKSFIVDLPKPENYFGPERIFGRDLLAQDDPAGMYDGLDVIRIVPDEEISLLRPKTQSERDAFEPEITVSLENALRYFWLASAARIARGQSSEHTTMLLHTSQHIAVHNKFKTPIEQYRDEFFQQLQRINSIDDSLVGELRSQWETEIERFPASEVGERSTTFNELWPHLPQSVKSCEVIIENSLSTSRIDYEQPGRIQIVVGGNTLARGLTLEGLIVSFFLRSSTAYDTLLQMGRWFGYRPGYADLPRIWMTQELSDYFKDLATVEQEIRNDIAVYAMDEVSPLDFGVRIRKHPTLEITSRLKMQAAIFASISYSGSRQQTVLFLHKDRAWLDQNIEAAAALIGGLQSHQIGESLAFFGVSVGRVLSFFERYAFHPDSRAFNSALIKKYIAEQNKHGNFLKWNLVVRGRKESDLGSLDLAEFKVPLLNRAARERRVPDSTAHIGTLMTVGDVVLDLNLPKDKVQGRSDEELIRHERQSFPPLLIIYPIAKDSIPTNQAKPRSSRSQTPIPLNAVQHLIGVGLVFPAVEKDTVLTYMTADLSSVERDEVEFNPEDEDES